MSRIPTFVKCVKLGARIWSLSGSSFAEESCFGGFQCCLYWYACITVPCRQRQDIGPWFTSRLGSFFGGEV